MTNVQANILTSKFRVWSCGKEGWKEEDGEGSWIDKSEPKRGSHSPPKLEAGQKIIHFLRYRARQVKLEEQLVSITHILKLNKDRANSAEVPSQIEIQLLTTGGSQLFHISGQRHHISSDYVGLCV